MRRGGGHSQSYFRQVYLYMLKIVLPSNTETVLDIYIFRLKLQHIVEGINKSSVCSPMAPSNH